MALAGGFFKSHVHQGHMQHEEYSFINIGKEQFHALAVALIDSLQTTPRGNDATLKKILERFYQYFPKYVNNQPYLTLPERMKIVLDSNRKSELVDCMAYVLRQLVVDELYAHPLKYREAFSGLHAETSKNYLRNPGINLPASTLDALAQVLGVTIILSFKEPGKELRKREVYVGDEQSVLTKLSLLIQVQGDQYFPAVRHKADFTYVGHLAISAPKPVEDTPMQPDTLADILSLIAADNKELLHAYEQWRKTILSMVVAGELTCKQLMDLYITFLPVSPNNTLSSSLLELSERKTVIAGVPVEKEQHIIELLASSLAAWISTKQIDPDSIFDQLEKNPSVVLG